MQWSWRMTNIGTIFSWLWILCGPISQRSYLSIRSHTFVSSFFSSSPLDDDNDPPLKQPQRSFWLPTTTMTSFQVLLTGASGYLGQHLLWHWMQHGIQLDHHDDKVVVVVALYHRMRSLPRP